MAQRKKKSSIGTNPLDAVVPRRGSKPAKAETTEELPEKVAKERVTIHISSDLIDRVRDAVYWSPGLTVAGFAEEALSRALESLEKKRGEPFPARKGQVKRGRPLA